MGGGGGGAAQGGGGRAPPIFYPRDFINIHACKRKSPRSQCILRSAWFGPTKMELLPTPMLS